MHAHPQGWVYFQRAHFVTDEDLRDPKVLASVNETCASFDISGFEEDIEVQIHASEGNALVVNHNFCAASYNLEDVKTEALEMTDVASS